MFEEPHRTTTKEIQMEAITTMEIKGSFSVTAAVETLNDIKTTITGTTFRSTDCNTSKNNKQSSNKITTYIVISIIVTITMLICTVLCIYKVYTVRKQNNER